MTIGEAAVLLVLFVALALALVRAIERTEGLGNE